MTLKTERELLKKEVTKLRRENTRLANANVKLNTTISKMATDAAASSDWEKRWGEVRSELSDITRSKNKAIESKVTLERTVSSLVGEKEQLEAVLKHIQGDIRVVSEVLYGQEFDPSNIDKLMPMMSNGIEYVPKVSAESVGPYVEPVQHLLRIIWRHTYWGLNPMNFVPAGHQLYGDSPR